MFYYLGIVYVGYLILKSIFSLVEKPYNKIDIRGNKSNFKIDLYTSKNDPDINEFKMKYDTYLSISTNNYFVFRFDNLKKNLINDKQIVNEFDLLTKFVNFVIALPLNVMVFVVLTKAYENESIASLALNKLLASVLL